MTGTDMTEAEARLFERLMGLKSVRRLCPDTVKSVACTQLARQKSFKEAEKAARARLHAMTGAYFDEIGIKKAEKCLSEYIAGDEGAVLRLLSLHASTRERGEYLSALTDEILLFAGGGGILDAACGLYPIYLGLRGAKSVTGLDMNGALTDIINAWNAALDLSIRGLCADVVLQPPEGEYSLALFMKLLPVLETERAGSALKLLKGVNARRICVTFPTKTLGGRGIGMEKNYDTWLTGLLTEEFQVIKRFTLGSELVYFINKNI